MRLSACWWPARLSVTRRTLRRLADDLVRGGSPLGLARRQESQPGQALDGRQHRLPAQAGLSGDRAYTRISPVGPEVGIEPDDQVNLDRGAPQRLERFGAEQVVLNPEEIGIHGEVWPVIGADGQE